LADFSGESFYFNNDTLKARFSAQVGINDELKTRASELADKLPSRMKNLVKGQLAFANFVKKAELNFNFVDVSTALKDVQDTNSSSVAVPGRRRVNYVRVSLLLGSDCSFLD
jgi:hypothetical protein